MSSCTPIPKPLTNPIPQITRFNVFSVFYICSRPPTFLYHITQHNNNITHLLSTKPLLINKRINFSTFSAVFLSLQCYPFIPSVLWHCWLGGRKGIRPVKNWVVGCWHGYLSGARCRLAYVSADATATASVKSRLVLPFWYRLTRLVPEKGPLNGCVFLQFFLNSVEDLKLKSSRICFRGPYWK